MQAFHNDPIIKDKYLKRVLSHQELDEIIKGKYWENGKGCAVGCTIHGSNHKDYESELGIPEWLAKVEDKIFEGMPLERSKKWPKEFLESINIGSDLNKIKIPFLIVIIESLDTKYDRKKFPKVKTIIDEVLFELKRTKLSIEKLKKSRTTAAADAAAYAAAAADAAYAAAYADAAAYAAAAATAYAYAAAAATAYAYAADAAADAYAYAADAAADAAAYAYAADATAYAYAAAAREKQFEFFADKLLELIKECK